MRTKEMVYESVERTAKAYGFSFVDNRIVDEKHFVNFFSNDDLDFEDKDDVFVSRVALHFKAAIAIMGGEPTPDELKEMAIRIMDASELVKTLEFMSVNGWLTYEIYYMKKMNRVCDEMLEIAN